MTERGIRGRKGVLLKAKTLLIIAEDTEIEATQGRGTERAMIKRETKTIERGENVKIATEEIKNEEIRNLKIKILRGTLKLVVTKKINRFLSLKIRTRSQLKIFELC